MQYAPVLSTSTGIVNATSILYFAMPNNALHIHVVGGVIYWLSPCWFVCTYGQSLLNWQTVQIFSLPWLQGRYLPSCGIFKFCSFIEFPRLHFRHHETHSPWPSDIYRYAASPFCFFCTSIPSFYSADGCSHKSSYTIIFGSTPLWFPTVRHGARPSGSYTIPFWLDLQILNRGLHLNDSWQFEICCADTWWVPPPNWQFYCVVLQWSKNHHGFTLDLHTLRFRFDT